MTEHADDESSVRRSAETATGHRAASQNDLEPGAAAERPSPAASFSAGEAQSAAPHADSVPTVPHADGSNPDSLIRVRGNAHPADMGPAEPPGSPAGVDALQVLLQASVAAETLQKQFHELNEKRTELQSVRRQLDAERRDFEERAADFASEVASARAEQRQSVADQEQREIRLRQQEEQLQRQLAELRAAQRQLAEERVVLKQSVRAELDEERMKLAQERAIVQAERSRVRQQEESSLAELNDREQRLREEAVAERQRLAEEVRQKSAADRAEIAEKREELEAIFLQQSQELQLQAEELQQQREQFGEQVEQEEERLRDETEKKRQVLLTEQNNLQRRYRFQFEHLSRAREDLEDEMRQFRREQQLFRNERLSFLEQHRLRFRQLDRIRELVQQRERSLERERQILDRTRRSMVADLQTQERRSLEERDAVRRDLDSRENSIRSKESSLAELSARLDDRTQRLGRLRAELDQTQAETLEQRLVLEEARAAMVSDAQSPELARARIEQARQDVHLHFERLRSQLFAERDKLDAAAEDLAERQRQFRQDRADLEVYFRSRDEELNLRCSDSAVDEQARHAEKLEQRLHQLQETWQRERMEAERTIRTLLAQLDELETGRAKTAEEDGSGSGRDAA